MLQTLCSRHGPKRNIGSFDVGFVLQLEPPFIEHLFGCNDHDLIEELPVNRYLSLTLSKIDHGLSWFIVRQEYHKGCIRRRSQKVTHH